MPCVPLRAPVAFSVLRHSGSSARQTCFPSPGDCSYTMTRGDKRLTIRNSTHCYTCPPLCATRGVPTYSRHKAKCWAKLRPWSGEPRFWLFRSACATIAWQGRSGTPLLRKCHTPAMPPNAGARTYRAKACGSRPVPAGCRAVAKPAPGCSRFRSATGGRS